MNDDGPWRVPRQLTTRQAAAEFDVPETVIATWKRRNQLVAVGALRGRARGGVVPLYRYRDVAELAQKYHARKAATGR